MSTKTKNAIPPAWSKLLRLIPGYDPIATAEPCDYFDDELANSAIDFFSERLTLSKDSAFSRAGEPFHLQPWQASIVANLFGWQRLDERGEPVRRYRQALIGVPRKNGKSELVAGLGCLGFFWDREVGTEIYCAAKDRKQATILFSAAKMMVLRNPVLKSACEVYKNAIHRPEDNATFQPISKDAGGQHGTNPHIAIIDELHVHPDGEIVEALESGQGARREPILLYLSTSDHDRADSVCNEIWDYARRVRDGQQDAARFLPALWEADDKVDDWRDENLWRAVNPNLGVSVGLEFLRTAAKKAESIPRLVNSFKRLHLNMRTGQATEWLSMERWDECDRPSWSELPRLLEGKPCWIGMDLAQRHDLAAIVAVFPEEDEEGLFKFSALPFFFLPQDELFGKDSRLDQRKRGLYQQWAREGLIDLTPGDVIDFGRIHRKVIGLRERYDVRQIGCDKWNAEKTAQDLQGEGFDVQWVVQAYSGMSAGSKALEEAVSARRFFHGGHPVLREHARVCAVDEDPQENIRPSKKRSGDKIDGIVATIMGLSMALLGRGGPVDSIYEEQELFIL